MGLEVTMPIENCDYCSKKAKYFWFREQIFSTKTRFLCEEHKLMKENLK